jgi:uncharacterized protein
MASTGRPHKSHPGVDQMVYDIEKGDNDKVKKLLLEVGLEATDGYKRTAITWAAFAGNIQLLEWLISNGADLNHRDARGYSALHFAVQEKQLEAVASLIRNKADLEARDANGNTPLMEAVFRSSGDYRFVKLLLAHGADPQAKNDHDVSPRELAETMDNFDMKEFAIT